MTLDESVETTKVKNSNTETLGIPSATTVNDKLKDDMEDSFFSNLTRTINEYYEAVRKSRFAVYFCVLVYICICVLGNIVTGIILYKHNSNSSEQEVIQSSIPINNMNNSKEYTEEDYFELYQLFLNDNKSQVRRYSKILYSIYLKNSKFNVVEL